MRMNKTLRIEFLKFICSSVLLLASICAFAQVTPTISSFSPGSGSLGITVTITGTNFNTTSASNTVFFGATQATSVTATSSTQLIVAVPKGANYQYISVTNLASNLTAYSAIPFIVTFYSNSTADFTTDATVNPSGAINTYRMALGDLNGDGKPDLVVVDNNAGTSSATVGSDSPGNSNVYVFLNVTSSSGAISYVLSRTLTLTFNNGPVYEPISPGSTFNGNISRDSALDGSNNVSGVAIKDLDGDGKLDIAITFKNENILGNASYQGGTSCGNISITIYTYTTYKLAAFRKLVLYLSTLPVSLRMSEK